MLEVNTILNPFGWDENKKIINKVLVANIGKSNSNASNLYDYVYVIYEEPNRFSAGVLKHGVIRKHYQNQSSLHLLREILLDFGQSECKMSEEFMNNMKKEGRL